MQVIGGVLSSIRPTGGTPDRAAYLQAQLKGTTVTRAGGRFIFPPWTGDGNQGSVVMLSPQGDYSASWHPPTTVIPNLAFHMPISPLAIGLSFFINDPTGHFIDQLVVFYYPDSGINVPGVGGATMLSPNVEYEVDLAIVGTTLIFDVINVATGVSVLGLAPVITGATSGTTIYTPQSTVLTQSPLMITDPRFASVAQGGWLSNYIIWENFINGNPDDTVGPLGYWTKIWADSSRQEGQRMLKSLLVPKQYARTAVSDAQETIYEWQLNDGTSIAIPTVLTDMGEASVSRKLTPAIGPIGGAPTSLSIASPCVVNQRGHGFIVGDAVVITSTGALPTGLTAGNVYYVIAAGFTADSFQISATSGGSAINTSGTQTGQPGIFKSALISIATPGVVTLSNHGLNPGDGVSFATTGALPTGLSIATTYFVIPTGLTANTFQLSTYIAGAAINTTGSQSGGHTMTKTQVAPVGRTVTVSIATPGVVTDTGHPYTNGDAICLTTTGALPTGLVAQLTPYYVVNAVAGVSYQLAATTGGAAINTTGSQSGVHTATKVSMYVPVTVPKTGSGRVKIRGEVFLHGSNASAACDITLALRYGTSLYLFEKITTVDAGYATTPAVFGTVDGKFPFSAVLDVSGLVPGQTYNMQLQLKASTATATAQLRQSTSTATATYLESKPLP
jgi:hypothetical protein